MVTNLGEELSRFTQHMPRLLKLTRTSAKGLIALIHLAQAGLVFAELDIQLVNRLRSRRTNSEQGDRVMQWPDREVALFLNLSLEKSDTARHFVDTADLANERALKGVHIRVQLVYFMSNV